MSIERRPTCDLCGYVATDFVRLLVPFTRPPIYKIVCDDCIGELEDLVQMRNTKTAAGVS